MLEGGIVSVRRDRGAIAGGTEDAEVPGASTTVMADALTTGEREGAAPVTRRQAATKCA